MFGFPNMIIQANNDYPINDMTQGRYLKENIFHGELSQGREERDSVATIVEAIA